MLTEDEAELYDRQIRLWGVNAQSRLRQSKVLMIGFNGVASEVAKILVLAGIDTLTIVDDQPLQDSDLTSNLFCRPVMSKNCDDARYRTHQVREKLRTINPLVKVNIENASIHSKTVEELKCFDLVTVHSFMTYNDIISINQKCRDNNVRFYLVLDFGYFGFMFNDLGPNFKFTYDEYDKVSEASQSDDAPLVKHSGGEKDPIIFEEDDDDDETSDNDDTRCESSRPKKRRRIHSPARRISPPTKDRNEKKQLFNILSYVPFSEMISCKNADCDKKSSPALLISLAMLKFFDEHQRLPNSSNENFADDDHRKQDLTEVKRNVALFKDLFNIPESVFKKLDPEWPLNINGSLGPVCAILGGVAGQDMIRSLSSRDIPICNTFSFDGMEMCGVVERIGIASKKAVAAPVIRDYLEIE